MSRTRYFAKNSSNVLFHSSASLRLQPCGAPAKHDAVYSLGAEERKVACHLATAHREADERDVVEVHPFGSVEVFGEGVVDVQVDVFEQAVVGGDLRHADASVSSGESRRSPPGCVHPMNCLFTLPAGAPTALAGSA